MEQLTKEISKEMYDRCKEITGGRTYVPDELEVEMFGIAVVRGYGLYHTYIYQGDDGKYYVNFTIGSSCD